MTTNITSKDLRLKFSVAAIIWAEKALDAKLADIVSELESDTGPSLRTLRALLTAGAPSQLERLALEMSGALGGSVGHLDQRNGSRLIEEHGVAACSAAVGKAMGEFLATIVKDAA